MVLQATELSLPTGMGIALVGAYSSAMLFGITTHQVFRYFRMFPRDHFLIQRLVLVLWCLTTASTILVTHQSYHYLVSRRLQLKFLVLPVWSIKLLLLISGIPAIFIRTFLTHRLFILYRRSLWISLPLGMLASLGLGFCIATTVVAYRVNHLLVFSRAAEWSYDVTLVLAAVSDIITAAWLSRYLARNGKSYMNSETLLSTIILFGINAGWLVSALSTAAVICALSMSSKLVSLALTQIVGEVYVISFMTVLHSRRSRYSVSQIGSFDLGSDSVHRDLFGMGAGQFYTNGTQTPRLALQNLNAFTVHITKETHTVIDKQDENAPAEFNSTEGTVGA